MRQGRRRINRRITMVCGAMLAGVLITWLVVLGLGISIPLDGFRSAIETAASRALGRDVHVDGALDLRPTWGPTLVAHDVRIASPAGQDDLLRAARVAVRLAPVALLRGEPRGRRVLIEDASINLDTRESVADRSGPAEPGGAYPRWLATGAELLAGQPDLQELVLRRVEVNYRDDSAVQPYQARLNEVSVDTRTGQPLGLVLQGFFLQQPYTIDLTGGRLADLLTPDGPWSWQAGVSFADTRLSLKGDLEASRQGVVMTIELQEDWPAEFARLASSFGLTPPSGRLSLQTDQRRPAVAGELQLPALDAVLRFGAGAGPASDAADQPVRGGEALADRPVSVPVTLRVADVPFYGQLSVAGQGTEPVVELALSANDANADGLLAKLLGTTGIRGHFRHIGFQASVRASGDTDIANRVALALQADGAKLSYGNANSERPVDVALDKLDLTLPAGEAVMMSAQGALLDEPFAVEFTADGLETLLLEENWPIRLTATGSGAVLDLSGPLAVPHGNTGTSLNVGIYGSRIGDLAAWLGVSPCAAASYKLRGQLVLAEDLWHLQFLQIQTDKTRLNGEVDWSGDDQPALLNAVLNFEALDPADIVALLPLMNPGADKGADRGIAIDMPVLPRQIEISNAEIEMTIEQLLLEPIDISEVSLSARIREGKLQRSPFHAHIGYANFQGYLDPATAETGVVFESEGYGSTAGGRLDKLFSSAVRWVGSSAVVPLRWMFRKKLAAGDPADCQVQGVKAGN